jgi:hypothetical protein
MNTSLKTCIRVALLATTLAAASTAVAQQAYPTTEAAGAALVDALGQGKADQAKVSTVLGAGWQSYVPVGGVDRKDVDAFLAKYQEKHAYRARKDGRQELVVGNDDWSLPIPLAKSGGGWKFDLPAGQDEIRTRRIGRNELDVQQAIRAYADAQADYAEFDRDGDGVLEYAQRLLSTDGKHDGLYWADDDSGQISPLGPRFGDETPTGIYHGYRYRILLAQGPSAPGGAYEYMLGQDMSRGFALVAWPAEYGETGITTFMIGHDGQVFERDLGTTTDTTVRAMKLYDPDSAWKEVPETPPSQG